MANDDFKIKPKLNRTTDNTVSKAENNEAKKPEVKSAEIQIWQEMVKFPKDEEISPFVQTLIKQMSDLPQVKIKADEVSSAKLLHDAMQKGFHGITSYGNLDNSYNFNAANLNEFNLPEIRKQISKQNYKDIIKKLRLEFADLLINSPDCEKILFRLNQVPQEAAENFPNPQDIKELLDINELEFNFENISTIT